MFIKKITVSEYKPLEHSGTSFISIDMYTPVSLIIGNNGSGKSTLLKEMTPLPSTSTDYNKGGYKELEIDHQGSEFLIRSSFDGKNGVHSFIKDGEELNKSGKSNIQADLCVSEFGLTSTIHTIITGATNICNMVRGNRKVFLLSCYPSNLAFVLDHHRRIVSELKSVQANIKMMNLRKVELEEMLIPKVTFQTLRESLNTLSELMANAERIEIVYHEEINRLKALDEYDPETRAIDHN